MADGPVGYWRLAETTLSAPAADISPPQPPNPPNNGTYSASGITLGQPGFHGGDTAALFDGATGRIVVPNSATNNPARITMEAKVRWDGPTGLQQRILEKESFAGTTQYGLSVMPDGQVHVELRMRSGASQHADSGTNFKVTLGAETHVAATYDGLAISIYLNGVPASTTVINTTPIDIDTKWPHTPPNDPEVALAIGDRMSIIPPDTRHRTFYGLIDEVAIFDKALSHQQILAHYQAQFVGTCLDDPGTILRNEWCLSALSKDLSGTLVLAGSTSHQCHTPPCKTLKTTHHLKLRVVGHPPCDSSTSKLLDGEIAVDRLVTVFDQDGLHRGFHAGDFVWQGVAGLQVDGRISGVTNVGTHRLPALTDCQRCDAKGVMEGRLCGQVTSTSHPELNGCQITADYRIKFDPGTTGGQGAVHATLEGVIICPCRE
jgi:hypothetical protein